MQHPAYNSAAWGLEPHSSGKLAVAKGRGGPLNLYWEVHGQGPTKIVVCIVPISSQLACRDVNVSSHSHTAYKYLPHKLLKLTRHPSSSWASAPSSQHGKSKPTTSATSTATNTQSSSSTTAASAAATPPSSATPPQPWLSTQSNSSTTSAGLPPASSTSQVSPSAA